jgi:hypothetical protein
MGCSSVPNWIIGAIQPANAGGKIDNTLEEPLCEDSATHFKSKHEMLRT